MTRRAPRLDLAAVARVAELADYVCAFAIRVTCDLGVADALGEGARTAADLAGELGCDAGALRRVLTALASKGLLVEEPDGTFRLTPLGAHLRSDHPWSLRAMFPLLPDDVRAWARFDHTVRTGEAAFEHVHRQRYYDFLAARPEVAQRVDRAVEVVNPLIARELARRYPWDRLGCVVDVGGGTGGFLAGILARHVTLASVLFDLPAVVAGAAAVLARAGVADRCTIVAGDFFASVPAGHPAYVMKTILHDWDDERALAVLARVRAAMPPDARLLVIEAVLPPGDAFDVGKLMDVHSLALAAGPDRDEPALRDLLAAGGFRVVDRHPTSHALTMFEAVPG